jgi:hypothetical protein
MTRDEQFDNSMCNDFIKTKVVDMTDAVIKQFIEDLHCVLIERKPDAPTEPKDDFLSRCRETVAELEDFNREYERKSLKAEMRHEVWRKGMSLPF